MMRMVSIAVTAAGSPFFQHRVELPDDRRLLSDRVPVTACRSGEKFHYLYASTDEVVGKHIRVMTCHPELPDVFTAPIPIAAGAPVHLRVEVDYERLRFAFHVGDGEWHWLAEQFDASILSREHPV